MKEALDFTLVTGGAGFIGTNLCARLLRDGCNVLVLDDMSSGTNENIRFLEDVALETQQAFEFSMCDIIDPNAVMSAINNYHITEIYHLACPASPPFYQNDPVHTILTCFQGTWNIIHVAVNNKCHMLLTSTSEVYGDPSITPQTESYRGNVNCYGERSCYDEGKRSAETLMYEMNKIHPGLFKVVRIFNTYGPHMRPDDGRFISNFICQSLKQKQLTIYGEGKQTRSICYVDDTVDGLIKMMHSTETSPVNIGNPSEDSVIGWAFLIHQIVTDVTGNKFAPLIEYKSLPSDDPLQRCPNIDRAKAVLGWEPQITPREGLKKTVEYFKKLLSK